MTSRDPFNNEFGNSLRDSILEKQVKDLRKRVEQLEYDAESVEQLQEEVSKLKRDKQDKILFVELYEREGILDEESLNALKDSLCNAIIYNGTLYKLSIKDGRMRKYFSNLNTSEDNLIDVNIDTGEFILHSAMDPVLQNHINDKVIHISQHDRDFWNNKRAYANQIDDETFELVISDELSRNENNNES